MVMDNPTAFTNPFQFEVTFECLQELPDDLEWKVIYVGNAEDSSGDQVLEEVMVGPVSIGINRFVLQANAPNPQSINNQDLIGVTVILITCSFMDNKFVQIGYYVNNEYSEPFEPENFPNPVDISKLYRNILADQPRVTRFPIDWSGDASAAIASLDGVPVLADAGQSEEIDEDEMQDEEDSETEDDEEGDDEGDEGEVDLDMEEDNSAAEESGSEEEEEEGEEEGSDPDMQARSSYADMVVMNEDSNSMDVGRMLEQ
eukprot:CAMPEP_0184984560 /NCGR_PEP_ID=MMETSP1098-20130426/13499_1 /TAXON_ID=89044 /ORGANISM="Spumella elongata, Strain CCAP 955/1" /LENGTH=257 /DNA_ID=CAMNT_0027508567 /DNA_START=113 /DNA_END=886 /DNA_ORIENTATION=-